jgi:hypothetical protein
MTKKTPFSPASEKGHLNGLVDGAIACYKACPERSRMGSLYKPILPRPVRRSFSEGGTPSWPKTSVNPVILSNFSSCSSCLRGEKISVISVKPRLIKDLRSTKVYVRKNNLFMQNKANFRKSQMNVSDCFTMNYEQSTMNYEIKNKPNTNTNKHNFRKAKNERK